MPQNRTINIAVTFNCTTDGNGQYGGGATYAATGANPANLTQCVSSDGTIDFTNEGTWDPAVYNNDVDITFDLKTPCTITPGGTQTPVVWAQANGSGMHVTDQNGNPTSQFVVTVNSSNSITVEDHDTDSNVYNYKPAVELSSLGNYYISLDPVIRNRPGVN